MQRMPSILDPLMKRTLKESRYDIQFRSSHLHFPCTYKGLITGSAADCFALAFLSAQSE